MALHDHVRIVIFLFTGLFDHPLYLPVLCTGILLSDNIQCLKIPFKKADLAEIKIKLSRINIEICV